MKGRWIRLSLSLGLAALLLVLLVRSASIDGSRLWEVLRQPGAGALGVILLTSLAHIQLGAAKWRLALEKTSPVARREARSGFYFFYSALAAALAPLLTVHITSVLVREIATRHHHRVSVLGSATSVFEQLFDVYVLALFLVPTAVSVLGGVGPAAWIGTAAMTLIVGWGLLWAAMPRLHRRAGRLASWTQGRRWVRHIPVATLAPLLDRRIATGMFVLAGLRYIAMLVRATVIAAAAGFAIPVFDVTRAFTAVQASQVVSATPGNLGVAEWTWSGALVFLGHEFSTGGYLALSVRVLSYASMVAVLLLAAIPFLTSAAPGSRKHERPS